MDHSTNSTVNSTVRLQILNNTLLKSILNDHFGSAEIVKLEIKIIVILYVVVFLLGFFGNGVLIIIIITIRKTTSVTNLLFCNMAVADLWGKLKHLVPTATYRLLLLD